MMPHDASRPFAIASALALIRIPGVFQLIFGLLMTPMGWFSGLHGLIPALLLVCSGVVLIEAGSRVDSKSDSGRRWGIFAASASGAIFLAISVIILFEENTAESRIGAAIYFSMGAPAIAAVVCLVRPECVAWSGRV